MKNFTNDITYCTNTKCKETSCYRNRRNRARTSFPYISVADFPDCPYWKDNKGKEDTNV